MKPVIDFETRSACDLKKAGPWKYSEHPSTDILCLCIHTGVKPKLWMPEWVKFFVPEYGKIAITNQKLESLIKDGIEAHNFEFENAIWTNIMVKRYGFPPLDINLCKCSAALAATYSLPRALEKACQALELTQTKDMAGHRTMLKLAKPRAARKAEKKELKELPVEQIDTKTFYDHEANEYFYFWNEDPEDIKTTCNYCAKDVIAEKALSKKLTPTVVGIERKVWLLDQKINRRGVYLDVESINNIIDTLAIHKEALLKEVNEITNGFLNSTSQVAKLKEWLLKFGIEVENLQKNTVSDVLKTGIPDKPRRVLEIRSELSKASTSKFQAMLERVQEDGRARSLFMYSGAGTGRWTAKAIQLQNLIRDSYKRRELEMAYEAFKKKDPELISLLFDDPFLAASKCLRGVIKAEPGKVFYCADYKSVEAIGTGWLAGEDKILTDFNNGVCIYKKQATATFLVEYDLITGEQRTIGKVQILSLGYQGGIGAFASLAKNYGIDLEALPAIVLPHATDKELEGEWGAYKLAKVYLSKNPDTMSFDAAVACDVLKRKWRANNPAIVTLWKCLLEAAVKAVENPNTVFRYRRVQFVYKPDAKGLKYLICVLPSGRKLYYFNPEIRDVKNKFLDDGSYTTALTCRTVDAKTKQWVRRPLYGGLLCENIVQALCRDLLAEAMVRLDEDGFNIVMHVHDEVVSEEPIGANRYDRFIELFEQVPAWAHGLPVQSDGWVGERFRK